MLVLVGGRLARVGAIEGGIGGEDERGYADGGGGFSSLGRFWGVARLTGVAVGAREPNGSGRS